MHHREPCGISVRGDQRSGFVLGGLGKGSRRRDCALDWKLHEGRSNSVIVDLNEHYLEGLSSTYWTKINTVISEAAAVTRIGQDKETSAPFRGLDNAYV